MSLKLYHAGQNYLLALSVLEGQDVFIKNASLFAQVSKAEATGIKGFGNEIKFRCYPNPFSEQITIEIESAKTEKLEVNIFDIDGKLGCKLYSGKAGNLKTLVWDGRNGNGAKAMPGTYLINANGKIEKVVLK